MRVVERETVVERVSTRLREPTVQECVHRVLASPRACREVVNGLNMLAERGGMESGEHAATVAAVRRLSLALTPRLPTQAVTEQRGTARLRTSTGRSGGARDRNGAAAV